MAIQEADDDDQEDDNDEIILDDSRMSWTSMHRNVRVPSDKKTIEWVGDPVKDDGRKVYYRYNCFYCIKLLITYFFSSLCISLENIH